MIIKYIVIYCVHGMRDVFCQVMSWLVLAFCAINLSAYFALGFNNQFNEITFDLSYSRNVFRAHLDWTANTFPVAEFNIMDLKSFKLSPLPEDFRSWIVWLEKKVPIELEEIQLSAKNRQKNTEHFSLYPIFLLGMRWDLNKELWPRPNFAKYKLDAMTANSKWDDGDEDFLKREWTKHYFVDEDLHRSVQKQVVTLLRNAVSSHPSISRRRTKDINQLSPTDFLQGVRIFGRLREILADELRPNLAAIHLAATALGSELHADPTISYDAIMQLVDQLEQDVATLKFMGNDSSESLLVQQFVWEGRTHTSPSVAMAMQELSNTENFTVSDLQAAIKKFVPSAVSSRPAETNLVRAMNMVTRLVGNQNSQPAQAFMAMFNKAISAPLSDSSRPVSQKRREYTLEEQNAYIKKLQKRLRNQNTSGGGDGQDSSAGRVGRGRGRGAGRGAREANAAEAPPAVPQPAGSNEEPSGSGAAAFNAFFMDAVEPDYSAVNLFRESSSTSSEEVESEPGVSADAPGSTFSSVVLPDPGPPPPDPLPQLRSRRPSPTRKSDPPSSPRSSMTLQRFPLSFPVVLRIFGCLLVCGLGLFLTVCSLYWLFSPESLDIFSQSLSTFPKVVCTGLVSLGALTSSRVRQAQGGHVDSFLKAVILLAILILCFYPTGSHGAVDIQLTGGPPTLLRPSVQPRDYMFASPLTQEFLDQRAAVVNLVTHNDTSVFDTKWCVDGGANRHVHSTPTEFKNFRSVNIPVNIAKKGAVMQAIGVGDCDLHCVDNMGNPCVLTIKDFLCIPDANKSLISVSMLHRERYHCI